MSSKIRAWIDLSRVSNLPTVWTNTLAAAVLTGPEIDWPAFLPVVVSMSLLYSGGMGLNDVFDELVDREYRPGRPIPSGKIRRQQALAFVAVLFSSALLLLLAVPFQRAILAGLVLVGLIVWYDAYHKQSRLSILIMAACRAMVPMTTALALSGTIGPRVLIAAAVQYAYTLSISAVARHENHRAPFAFPVVPTMIAGISLIDGALMALWASPWWLLPGLASAALTRVGQRYVRGD